MSNWLAESTPESEQINAPDPLWSVMSPATSNSVAGVVVLINVVLSRLEQDEKQSIGGR